MRLINLTQHNIVLRDSEGNEHVIIPNAPKGEEARVSATPGALEDWGLPVPVARPTVYGEVVGLPPPQDGVIYITSMLVAAQAKRPDVVSPGTGPNDGAIRNTAGQVVAVTRVVAHV